MHEITLDGYAAQCAEQPIRLGTAGSYGVETLRVMRKGEWVDYDIIIAFHPPKGDAVQMRLGSDNVVSVPAEATAVAGTGELTFAGYTDGVRQISVSQIYRVAATAGAEGIAPAEPTPDVVQQILSAASNAEEIAQSVRDDADAGKFNGPQGPKGEQGPQGEKGDPGADAKVDDSTIGENPWSSKHIIDMLCPPLEESGNPVVCYPVAGYSLGVKASWEPMQEGSGMPSPENIRPIKGRDSVTVERCGENLIDPDRVTDVSAPYGLTTQYVSGEITISGIYSASAENASFSFMSLSYKLPPTTKFVPLGLQTSGCTLIGIRFTNEKRNDIAIDLGGLTNGEKVEISFYLIAYVGTTAPTTYTPYIGQTNTLTLPETVYGGEVDAVTGNGKRTWGIIDNYAGETIPGEWISDRDIYSADKNPTVGAQVAYRLAEHVPFTAAGAQPIPALSGTNTLLTDADSVSISGRADLIYIIKKIQEK